MHCSHTNTTELIRVISTTGEPDDKMFTRVEERRCKRCNAVVTWDVMPNLNNFWVEVDDLSCSLARAPKKKKDNCVKKGNQMRLENLWAKPNEKFNAQLKEARSKNVEERSNFERDLVKEFGEG